MTGIYLITNKINGIKYVGQAVDIHTRFLGHKSDAKNRPISDIDKAIHDYGIDNFTLEILEECKSEELDEKEKNWIKFYDTYKGVGYNKTPGGNALHGEDHPNSSITEQEVWDIREKYKNHYKFSKIVDEYTKQGIQLRCLQKIWKNETWKLVHQDVYTEENKLWHKTKGVGHSEDQVGKSSKDRSLTQEEIDNIVLDFKDGMPIAKISQKYGRDYGIIKKYLNNPKAVEKVKYKGRKIKNIETGLIFSSISSAAKWANCGATTITRHLNDSIGAGLVPETQEKAHWIEI